MKSQLPPQDVYDLLKEHMGFLSSSIAAFHDGNFAEAKRIASSIRTLLHHSKDDESLLTQFKLAFNLEKDVIFFDIKDYGKLSFFNSSVIYSSVSIPMLKKDFDTRSLLGKFPCLVTKNDWLNTVVLKYGNKTWSRNDSVTFLRNKIGGQHFNGKVNQFDYENMKSMNFIRLSREGMQTEEESISLLHVSIYESGISMWHSVRQYMEYASRVTNSKGEPDLYKNYYPYI
ncbi:MULTISPECIES: hypothetical protein [unclassified Photobacterium]|uniref:hypothetical protein n=1 Tax=unclassified Photobacterium TaxID=2628852 RepID=UPI000D17635E|nr:MULTISPECIES: hypothetical protein [unclassified Photobacterium]PSV38643.1 hypothetical protein C9J46_20815 [Photobacterium sp. GB-36]PSV50235.1 hypothetical protein C9J45_21005 [Photobacterium sp. GB-1]